MNIREYTNDDREILKRYVEGIQDFMVMHDPIKRVIRADEFGEVTTNDLLETIDKQGGKIYFAEENGRLLGFVAGFLTTQSDENKLSVVENKLGYVAKLFVEEYARGKGAGRLLLEKIEEYFKAESCDTIWIDVDAYNQTAHGLYEKFGFVDREIGMLKNL